MTGPARSAAWAFTHAEALVSATRSATADQPETGGHRTRKQATVRPRQRSLLAPFPSGAQTRPWLAHVRPAGTWRTHLERHTPRVKVG